MVNNTSKTQNTIKLTAAEIKLCHKIKAEQQGLTQQRATALLLIHEESTYPDAAEGSGLSIGQVRYLVTGFRKRGMGLLETTAKPKAAPKPKSTPKPKAAAKPKTPVKPVPATNTITEVEPQSEVSIPEEEKEASSKEENKKETKKKKHDKKDKKKGHKKDKKKDKKGKKKNKKK